MPSSDLDAAAKTQSQVHMTAVAPAGPIPPENLLAFLALLEAATARAKANLTAWKRRLRSATAMAG
jgi:hypothetical protein